jgi:hypothetical protein
MLTKRSPKTLSAPTLRTMGQIIHAQLSLSGDNAHDPDWLGSDSGRITGYSEATRSVEQTGHSPLTDRCGSIMEAIPSPALGSCRDA